jgi:hypothetical protein
VMGGDPAMPASQVAAFGKVEIEGVQGTGALPAHGFLRFLLLRFLFLRFLFLRFLFLRFLFLRFLFLRFLFLRFLFLRHS